jgi:tetratricopeptide (TPR) repeat protein
MATIAAVLIALALGASETPVDPIESCNQEDNRQLQISGCSQLIGRGETTDPVPYINRGIAFASTRQFDRALDDFNAAIALSPNESLAYYNRGNVYYDLGRFARAARDYSAALKLDPDNALFYYNRALAHERSGKRKLAVRDLRHAVRIDPEFAAAREYLALIDGRQQRKRKK